jgi:hypothetical protein
MHAARLTQRPLAKAMARMAFLFLTTASLNAQNTSVPFINKLSETITGQTDTVPVALISKVGNGYMVSSNQKISATQNDIKTVGLSAGIVSLWQQLFNVGNRKAFTTATTTDAQGNYYVAGSTYINALNGQDLTVIKYNASGVQQWVKHYNGPGNNYDIAAAIKVDNAGNVFVTGASVGSLFAMVDFVTIKYNTAGIQQWVSRYNGANGFDIPAGLVLDNAGNPIVSGASASSSANTNLDVTTVKYNAATGAQITVQKQINVGNGQDKVVAETRDNVGNVYVTGGVTYNGIDYDVQTIKYDVNMNPVWIKTYDGYGKSDLGNDIAVDNNGNVVITGYATLPNLDKQLIVISYAPNGNVNWTTKYQYTNIGNAEGIKVKIKNTNEIFVGATITTTSNSDMAILRFDANGRQNIQKIYNSANNYNDRLLDLMIDGNTIIVSGQQNTGTINNNVVVKYEYADFTRMPTAIGSGINTLEFVSNEIIVLFTKQVMKMNAINNMEFTFGKLNDFVQDSTVKKMINALDPTGALKLETTGLTARKIFLDLTEKDSLSLTRTGNYTKVPEFYTYLLVSIPPTINAQTAAAAVTPIKPDIKVGQLNHIGHLTSNNPPANDPLFTTGQPNLHPTVLFPNANINADSAWAISTGAATVKVGILDSGVESNHQDLQSNIQGENFDSPSTPIGGDPQNHGTKIAGVIAAKRNNTIGVAGIAGGDATQNQTGVTIYDCTISDIFGVIDEAKAAAGIVKSSKGANIGGYGLDIINCSWAKTSSYYQSAFGYGLHQSLVDALNFANRNGVSVVFSKGNAVSLPVYTFPADWADETMMSVGSSGNDGQYCLNPINCNVTSNHGGFIDFLAPGSRSIITTTGAYNNFYDFAGTSAAAAHVTGASALLMSYWNKPYPDWSNLQNADCEQILKRTAADLTVAATYSQSVGYDSVSGWGRINVNRALKAIDKTKHRILHISEAYGNTGVSTPTINLVHSGNMLWKNYLTLPTANYQTEIYERKVQITYTLLATEQILGAWAMNKECYGSKFDTSYIDPDRPHYANVSNVTQNSALLTTYFYKIPSQNITMPYAQNNISSALTLYTYDQTGAIGIKEYTQTAILRFKAYPNPSTDKFKCIAEATKNANFKLEVFNVLGQLVITKNWKVEQGLNDTELNLTDMANGIYTLKLSSTNNETFTYRLVKN